MSSADIAKTDFDSPWKEALEVYFEAFMLFCFPDIHADTDWLVTLQADLETAFRDDVIQIMEEKEMPLCDEYRTIG